MISTGRECIPTCGVVLICVLNCIVCKSPSHGAIKNIVLIGVANATRIMLPHV